MAVPFKQKDVPMTNDENNDFIGSVRAIRIEKANIVYRDGAYVEHQPVPKQESTFDEDGRKILELNYLDGTRPTKKNFEYDADGRLIEAVEYDPDGLRICRRVYTYSADGKRVEEVSYRGDDKAESDKFTSVFDDDGRQVSLEVGGGKDKPLVKTYLSYDDKGRIREMITCANKSAGGIVVPAKGGHVALPSTMKIRMKEAAPYDADLLVNKTVFIYDDTGHVTEISSYGYDNTLSSKTRLDREFDSHGNWIKETRSRWNSQTNSYQPVEVTYRAITYYAATS